MDKPWMISTLLVLAIVLALTGCGPTAAPAAPPTEPPAAAAPATEPVVAAPTAEPTAAAPAAAGEPVKIVIFVGFGTGTDPEQIDVHTQIAQEFNSTHTDIQIEFLTVDYAEHDSKFSTMLAADMAPDLVMPIGVMGVAAYYDEWLDVTPYIQRDNYDTSDFYGPSLKLQTYPDKTIGLPIGVYPSVTFYNQDLFDKAGLDYPPHKFGDPAWTYDQLIELSKKLTLDANGNDAASPDFDPEKIVQWGWDGWDWGPFKAVPAKFDGNPLGVSTDYKTAEMNSVAWVEAMQFVQDSIWKWYIRPSGEMSSAAFADVDPLESGQVAMWEIFSWMAYAYPTWTEAFNWDVAAVPTGPHGNLVAQANGDTFTIPKSSKHPDQAWEVAKWLMEPEVMARLAKSYGCIPARKSLANGWMEGMKADFGTVDWQVFIDSIEYMDAQPNHEGWTPNHVKVWDASETAYILITTEKDHSVQEVMNNLNEEVQGYLDEYWASH
jgi:multiple sugar transport system substrate-binding protein